MKVLRLSVDDNIYDIIVKFLSLLPKDKVSFIEEYEDIMTEELLKEKMKALEELEKGETTSLEEAKKEWRN